MEYDESNMLIRRNHLKQVSKWRAQVKRNNLSPSPSSPRLIA